MKKLLAAAVLAAVCGTTAIAADSLISFDSPVGDSVIALQWVQPDASGAISGRVVLASGSNSDLTGDLILSVAGSEPRVALVSPTGEFTIGNVTPGVYTLVYQAPQAFAAHALQVVAPRELQALPSTTVVAASSLAPQSALATIARYQPPRTSERASIVGDGYLAAVGRRASVAVQTSIQKVSRSASGGMRGRLVKAGATASGLLAASEMNVLILKDGELIEQVISDSNGEFEIASLATGNYDLLASGNNGFAVLGFELVDLSETLTSVSDETATLTAKAQDVAGPLSVQVATADPYLMSGPAPFGDEFKDDSLAPPFGGGGGGGSFGGGGGGGGLGGGGGGGLLGLAAIGGIIAVAVSDNDDDFVPPTASPAIP